MSDREYEYSLEDYLDDLGMTYEEYLDDLGMTYEEYFGYDNESDMDSNNYAEYLEDLEYEKELAEYEKHKRDVEKFVTSYKNHVCTICKKKGHFENKCFQKSKSENLFCHTCNSWNNKNKQLKSTSNNGRNYWRPFRSPIHDPNKCYYNKCKK